MKMYFQFNWLSTNSIQCADQQLIILAQKHDNKFQVRILCRLIFSLVGGQSDVTSIVGFTVQSRSVTDNI